MDSLAATSLLVIGRTPFHRRYSIKEVSPKPKIFTAGHVPLRVSLGRRMAMSFGGCKVDHSTPHLINALAAELMKEAYWYREDRIPLHLNYRVGGVADRKSGLWPPGNKADNPSLCNPLLRQERMGCGWFVAILEWEGVLIEDNPDLEKQAWMALSQEEGKSPPSAFTLRRIEGMKNEQAISEVLCWSRVPEQLKRMASRKEEIQQVLQGGIYRLRTGSLEFINMLMNYKIPMILASTCPRKTLETTISAVVAAEDVHRGKPDPEMFVYAAQLLNFIPERCIVFGNSNLTVEAAHDAQMKCVTVASHHPAYELGAADLVVRRLDELSMVDLKNLAVIESPEFESSEPELEMEEEGSAQHPSSPVSAVGYVW